MPVTMPRYLPLNRFLLLLTLLTTLLGTAPPSAAADALQRIRSRGYLVWGTDAEGGAPYVFPDPRDPSRMIGFEMEIAQAIARELGVKLKLAQNAWESLIPALERGDSDLAMNGIEITPEREQRVLFSVPYYVYSEQLVVRRDERRMGGLPDLKGLKVGTLQGAVAQEMLNKVGGIDTRV